MNQLKVSFQNLPGSYGAFESWASSLRQLAVLQSSTACLHKYNVQDPGPGQVESMPRLKAHALNVQPGPPASAHPRGETFQRHAGTLRQSKHVHAFPVDDRPIQTLCHGCTTAGNVGATHIGPECCLGPRSEIAIILPTCQSTENSVTPS